MKKEKGSIRMISEKEFNEMEKIINNWKSSYYWYVFK